MVAAPQGERIRWRAIPADGGKATGDVSTTLVATALMLHLVVGAVVEKSHGFAYVHEILTLVGGFWWWWRNPTSTRAAYVAAYISGAEVLWRMADASLLWEIGKYSCCALELATLWRLPRKKPHVAATIYFLLLVPSAVITYIELGFVVGRQPISFNLSGPFAVAMSVWFFSNISLTADEVRRLFLCFVIPASSLAAATLNAMLTAEHLRFGNNSNMETSGGYGPNQVSAILGLGVLLIVLYLIQGPSSRFLRLILFVAGILLAIQSAMTFSRGGLVNAAISFLIATVFLVRDRHAAGRLTVLLAGLVLAVLIVLPQLESITGGALGRRFENPDTTHRDQIVGAELGLWAEKPVFGSGVGLARAARHAAGRGVSGVAHTEFSRALGEHGTFGLLAILILLSMPIQRLRQQTEPLAKALTAWCCVWAFLFMSFNAMRLMAPALVYGLAFVNWTPARTMYRLRMVRRVSIDSQLAVPQGPDA